MTTYIATITEQQDNWSELTIKVWEAEDIDTAQEMDDPVHVAWITTSAYTGLDDIDGNVDFDQLQFMADIETALAPEWVVTDWIASHGDSGSIIGAQVAAKVA